MNPGPGPTPKTLHRALEAWIQRWRGKDTNKCPLPAHSRSVAPALLTTGAPSQVATDRPTASHGTAAKRRQAKRPITPARLLI